ncbi:C40 family peptidase [Cohnella faecalis]|uniref:Peptidoglycan endopeptidase n=1 Tax=Cohnella faecalis TaxID=2315694 RepID=A0A398CK08_9BACL|nr:NlpC/P60 family protein [Cohnella faecalis]RIE02675.1 peptidoglycan endopeptidase [Cohnella faecalis]
MRKQAGWLLAAGIMMLGSSAWLAPQASAAAPIAGKQTVQAKSWPQNPEWNWSGSGNNNESDQNSGSGSEGGSDSGVVSEGGSDSGSGNSGSSGEQTGGSSTAIEKIIKAGMDYWGTPYEFGSDRDTDKTFDCSDFVKWIFKHAADVTLPSDSRKQGAFVKEHGNAQTDWHKLKRGDLMFFMSYEGSNASDYSKASKSSERITHVGVYLGDGKILHTYSKASGGVQTTDIEGTTWEYRFLFGGSAL